MRLTSRIGLTNATDRQKIQAFIKTTKRAGFCNTELNDFDALCMC